MNVYYLAQFKDHAVEAKKTISRMKIPAGKMIRYNFDEPSMYGDWYSLDLTEQEFDNAKQVGKHYLKLFHKSWEK